MNQTCLRSDSYASIKQLENGGVSVMREQGKRFVLPATFVGGPQYMKNLYLDAMTKGLVPESAETLLNRSFDEVYYTLLTHIIYIDTII